MNALNPDSDCSVTGLKTPVERDFLKSCAPHGGSKGNLEHHACKSVGFYSLWGAIPFKFRTVRSQPIMLRLAVENTSSGLETGWIKNGVKLLLPNFRARCDAPRARGNGLVWLTVFPPRPKAPSRAYSGDVQAQRFPTGFRCVQPPATFPATSKPEQGNP